MAWRPFLPWSRLGLPGLSSDCAALQRLREPFVYLDEGGGGRQRGSEQREDIYGRFTLLSLPMSLMCVKFFIVTGNLYRLVAPRPRHGEFHRLVEEIESLNLLDGLLRTLWVVEDDKGLSLGLDILPGQDVDDVAELREDDLEGIRECLRLDAFLQVLHIDTTDWSA
jgi:hypothetical protein